MKRLMIICLMTVILLPALLLADSRKLAMVTKSRGDVKYRHENERSFDREAKPGTVLENGDVVKTGREAFVALIFLDDKTQVKLLENCDLEIRGQKVRDRIRKELSMDYGTLKAEVSRQKKTEFKISTPTSVASVKGTAFWMISDPRRGDTVIGLSGLVELMNQLTGFVTEVGAGQSGFSMPDGSVNTQNTNPENIPNEEDDGDDDVRQIRIRFQNEDGETKNMIIDYR